MTTPPMSPADGAAQSGPAAREGRLRGSHSSWWLSVQEFASHKMGLIGVGILAFFVLFCFLGPLVYRTEQVFADPLQSSQPPSPEHWLGTDTAGFDVLGRLMEGGQTALLIGFFAAFIATVIGTVFGAVAGLVGGIVDGFMMRAVDILLAIPFLFVVLILATKYQGTVTSLSLVIGLFAWLVPARLVRGEVRSLRERDYVLAALVMGSGKARIIRRHLIPNALSVVIVNITFQLADGVLVVAYLGFLGFGLAYPAVSWGDMLAGAQDQLANGNWWLVYPVGTCLVLVVLAANFVGDALRDTFDVRLRRR